MMSACHLYTVIKISEAKIMHLLVTFPERVLDD